MPASPAIPPSGFDSLTDTARLALMERRMAYLEKTLRSIHRWMVARTVVAVLAIGMWIGLGVWMTTYVTKQLGGILNGDASGILSLDQLQTQVRDAQDALKLLQDQR